MKNSNHYDVPKKYIIRNIRKLPSKDYDELAKDLATRLAPGIIHANYLRAKYPGIISGQKDAKFVAEYLAQQLPENNPHAEILKKIGSGEIYISNGRIVIHNGKRI